MPTNQALRAIANRSGFDKGKELAQKSAVVQAKFISEHLSTLKEIDKKSRPAGWKTKKFKECVERINRREALDDFSLSFFDSLYELVIGKLYGLPSYKSEFYKNRPTRKY